MLLIAPFPRGADIAAATLEWKSCLGFEMLSNAFDPRIPVKLVNLIGVAVCKLATIVIVPFAFPRPFS
jgi:hypothetical protein